MKVSAVLASLGCVAVSSLATDFSQNEDSYAKIREIACTGPWLDGCTLAAMFCPVPEFENSCIVHTVYQYMMDAEFCSNAADPKVCALEQMRSRTEVEMFMQPIALGRKNQIEAEITKCLADMELIHPYQEASIIIRDHIEAIEPESAEYYDWSALESCIKNALANPENLDDSSGS